MRALVVAGSAAGRRQLRSELRTRGFAVDEADDGVGALAKARAAPPAVVVAALPMQASEGCALLHSWKADPQLRVVPYVVCLPTSAGDADQALAHALGADAVLPGPTAQGALAEAVEVVLRDVAHGAARPPRDGGLPARADAPDEAARRAAEQALARVDRLHAMLSQANHVLVRATDEAALLAGVCDAAVTHGGFRFAWVGMVDNGGALRPVASAGDDHGYVAALNASVDPAHDRGTGPAAAAVRRGQPVVSNDFLHDPATRTVHAAARAAGVRASAALPLHAGGRVVGSLSLYADAAGFFGDREIATLERMAADVSFGLDTLAQRAALGIAAQVVEASPVVLFRWGPMPARRIEYVSSNVAQWGYDARVLAAERTPFAALVHPEDLPRLHADLERRLAEGRAGCVLAYRLLDAAGAVRWVEDATSVLRAPDGNVRHLQGTLTDITARRRAEQAAAAVEAQYRQLFDANPNPMWLFDAATLRFLAVNDAAVAHYGWTREAFLAMTIADIRPAEERVRLSRWRGQPRPSALADAGVWRHLRSDGSPIDVRITSSPVRFAGRAAILVLAHDVTDQLRAARQLRESARVVEMAGRLAALGGWEATLSERRVELSDEVCRIHDLPPGTRLATGAWIDACTPESRSRAAAAFAACEAEGRPFDEELEIVTAQGRRRWVRSVGRAVRDGTGAIVRIEGALQDITARKRTEQRLHHSEAFAQATLDSLHAHIALVGADGVIVAVNQAWRRFAAGNPPVRGPVHEGANYLAACDAATGDDLGPARAVGDGIRAVLAGRQEVSAVEYACHAPGERRWFVARVTRFAGPGAPLAVVAHEDITARKEAELALAASERRFHATFEQAAVGIARMAPDGRWLEVNDKLCAIVGRRRDALLAGNARDITHPDDLERGLALDRRVLDGAVPTYTAEMRYVRGDGSAVWVDLTVSLVRAADGRPEAFVVVVEDIGARRLAQGELRKLSQAVEQSTESIVITDADGTIEYVNDSFVQTSGYARDELIGRNPRLLQSGATPQATYAAMWSTLAAGRAWTGEFHNRRKDGSVYLEAAVVSPLRAPDGRVTHYVGVKEDVTARRRTEEELERHRTRLEELVRERTAQLDVARRLAEAANAAKSAFLANMSHEIRTPMNGVLGMLEVLAQGDLGEEQRELVLTAQESGRTLLGIIDDILDFSKIEAGRLELAVEPVALGGLAEDLCDALVSAASRQDVDIDVYVAPALPERVLVDPLRLRQVLMNLLGNAVKFSAGVPGRRGRVGLRVTARQMSPLVLSLVVTDNGIGMGDAVVARLFTPFTQAEASTTRRYGGSGLGLTICKRLVDLMGGRLEVASRPGAGSTFTVTLPVEADGAPARSAVDLGGLACVIVDDPALDGEALAAYLAHAGASVHRVAAAEETTRAEGRDAMEPVLIRCRATVRDGAALPAGRQLLITRGRRRRARVEAPGVVSLDGTAIRRETLLRAVAVAAGRAGEAFLHPAGSTAAGPVRALGANVEPPTVEAARERGELILVAEDDEVNRRVIARQLALIGRTAEIAADGGEALRLWRAGRHALLLTDLHMPELDGYALTATIRREERAANRQPRLPIVALTANALRGEAERAQAAEMDAYLTKPLRLEQLQQTLDRLLGPTGPAPASPAVEAGGAIDLSVPRRLFRDNEGGLRRLLAVFRDANAGLDDAVRRALDAGDVAAVGAAAHKLKSSAGAIGAAALAAHAAALEADARAGDLAAARARLPAFAEAFGRVMEAIGRDAGSSAP